MRLSQCEELLMRLQTGLWSNHMPALMEALLDNPWWRASKLEEAKTENVNSLVLTASRYKASCHLRLISCRMRDSQLVSSSGLA
jgi:hypothetical protein